MMVDESRKAEFDQKLKEFSKWYKILGVIMIIISSIALFLIIIGLRYLPDINIISKIIVIATYSLVLLFGILWKKAANLAKLYLETGEELHIIEAVAKMTEVAQIWVYFFIIAIVLSIIAAFAEL